MWLAFLACCTKKKMENTSAPVPAPADRGHTASSSLLSASGQTSKHPAQPNTGTQIPQMDFPKLRMDALKTYDPSEEDTTRRARFFALKKLANSRTREGVEIVMEVLLSPDNEKLWWSAAQLEQDNKKPTAAQAEGIDALVPPSLPYETFCRSMNWLSKTLEGTPPPTQDSSLYTAEDVPGWRVWWEANRNNLRFKKSPDPAK